uniref:Uncharacterized protein n=1 Tax=Ditylenchus dipsaci TaxID=166011 RepID=A0A915E220_9BILA
MVNNQNHQHQCPGYHPQDGPHPLNKFKNSDPQNKKFKEIEKLEEETMAVTPSHGYGHRTTRSPANNVSDSRIQQWKMELSTGNSLTGQQRILELIIVDILMSKALIFSKRWLSHLFRHHDRSALDHQWSA